MVNFPKREDKTLDLILTNNADRCSDLQTLPPIASSDHLTLLGNIVLPDHWYNVKRPIIMKKSFGEANYDNKGIHLNSFSTRIIL